MSSGERWQNGDAVRGATILVIEDDPDMQLLISLQLAEASHQTVAEEDGPGALAWLAGNTPDLVVLDLMLPGMDGLEVCRRIRESYSSTALPVLMVSALGDRPDDRVRGLQAGANDFIAKPYQEDELLARINGLLEVKKTSQRMEQRLSRYLASAIHTQAKLNPDVLKQRLHREAVVMFADMRGFTGLTNNTQTGRMMDVLDEFFGAMMGVLDQYGGVVFDLLGDELMAAFNVPNATPFVPSGLAVRAAVEMQLLFRDLRTRWVQAGLKAKVGLGIGIHQGDVVLGNIGGEALMRYTIMGDVVNVAHRLVDLAGEGDIVVSAEVYRTLGGLPDGVRVWEAQAVRLKGIAERHDVFKLGLAP